MSSRNYWKVNSKKNLNEAGWWVALWNKYLSASIFWHITRVILKSLAYWTFTYNNWSNSRWLLDYFIFFFFLISYCFSITIIYIQLAKIKLLWSVSIHNYIVHVTLVVNIIKLHLYWSISCFYSSSLIYLNRFLVYSSYRFGQWQGLE